MKCVDIYDSRSWNEPKEITVMCRKNDGCPSSMDFFQEIHDHDDIFLIQVACWLISEKRCRLMDKCSCNGDTLSLTS